MSRGHVVEYTFINSARKQHFEAGVVPTHHVSPVLVRQSFQDDARNLGHSRFRVVAVVHLTAVPVVVDLADVVVHLRHDAVTEVARHQSGAADG